MQNSIHSEATAVLGGGCFWCFEAAFQEIQGVTNVTSGYAGGTTAEPTYEDVTSGTTGYAEVVRIEFDPQTITYSDLLDIFWAIHNPTTPNRQGNDVGSQYRSMIVAQTAEQQREATESIAKVAKLWDEPIVTQLLTDQRFYPAEPYHQNYFRNNPEAGYCQIVINPKLKHLRENFANRIRTDIEPL